MSSTEANWQSHHQNQSEAHAILSQLAALISPDGQLISRHPFPTPDAVLQLWSCGSVRTLFILCSKNIDQNFILDLLQTLSGLRNGKLDTEGIGACVPEIEVHLFGLKFHESFTSKLNFLKFSCKLYHVSISRSNERDIVLVKDFQEAASSSSSSQNLMPVPELEPANPESNPLSAQELSEFAQLGMELRKLRESN